MNLRPSGYEPDELPDCSTPRHYLYLHTIIYCENIYIWLKPSGWRRIRTFESVANRFTVCPLWPLGNPSILKDKADDRTRTDNLLITSQLLCQLSHIGILIQLQSYVLRPTALSIKILRNFDQALSHIGILIQIAELYAPPDCSAKS